MPVFFYYYVDDPGPCQIWVWKMILIDQQKKKSFSHQPWWLLSINLDPGKRLDPFLLHGSMQKICNSWLFQRAFFTSKKIIQIACVAVLSILGTNLFPFHTSKKTVIGLYTYFWAAFLKNYDAESDETCGVISTCNAACTILYLDLRNLVCEESWLHVLISGARSHLTIHSFPLLLVMQQLFPMLKVL
jgi:hypothetical protein